MPLFAVHSFMLALIVLCLASLVLGVLYLCRVPLPRWIGHVVGWSLLGLIAFGALYLLALWM
jgi:hypothetical protein